MSKVMGILSNFGLFTMLTHQIWSCQVTQDANLENFEFVLILRLILRKVKISNGKMLYFKSYQPKTSREGGGGKHQCL